MRVVGWLACSHVCCELARGQLQRVWAGLRALRKRVSQLAACNMTFFGRFTERAPRPPRIRSRWEIEFVFFLFGRALEGLAGRFTFAPRRHGVVDQFTMLALLSMAKLLPAAVLGAPAQPNDVVWFLLADGLESDANWKQDHSAIRKAASRL